MPSEKELGDELHTVLPMLVDRYSDRVLILVSDTCAVFCRHCCRRHFTSRRRGALTAGEFENIRNYITGREGIREFLLSGGAPMTLGDQELFSLPQALRSIKRDLVIRLSARMPVVLPQRVTQELAESLKEFHPLWMTVQ